MPSDLPSLLLPLLAAGFGAGLVAGLLGVGGGIVMVPVLSLLLPALGIDQQVSMHVAVATSLAVIVVTSIVSARSHARRDGVDAAVARRWGPAIAAGALTGALAARGLPGNLLRGLFAVLALIVGARLILQIAGPSVPLRLSATGQRASAALIGVVSAWLGIGGGTFSVPVLHGIGLGIHRAVGTSALLGLFIAVPGAIGFAIGGIGEALLPASSVGFVYLPAAAALGAGAVLFVPLGARLAHRLPQLHLRRVFGVFLLVAGLRMLNQALG